MPYDMGLDSGLTNEQIGLTLKNSGDLGASNLSGYVQGQLRFAKQYSFPICNLYEESGISILNKDNYIESDLLHPNEAAYTFIAQQTTDFIRKYGGFTNLTGKTLGVFGGSFSVRNASEFCKDVWESELGLTYTDYGVSGTGFARNNAFIDAQADNAASHDIYLLWCSTNDATQNAPIGTYGDTVHTTQHGGMYETVSKLLAINPLAKILIFSSLKAYTEPYMYDPLASR